MIALPLAHHPLVEALLTLAPMLLLGVALAVLVLRERRRSASTHDPAEGGER